jgi:hypothetical protein
MSSSTHALQIAVRAYMQTHPDVCWLEAVVIILEQEAKTHV